MKKVKYTQNIAWVEQKSNKYQKIVFFPPKSAKELSHITYLHQGHDLDPQPLHWPSDLEGQVSTRAHPLPWDQNYAGAVRYCEET